MSDVEDYTPDRGTVRYRYVDGDYSGGNHDPHAEFDRFIAKVRSEAWAEGLQAGWEECQNPGPFVNDWWDSKTPNPYMVEGEA